MQFLPGQPALKRGCADSYQWQDEQLLAYCSGNSFVIIRKGHQLAKTVLLPAEATALAACQQYGRIAVTCGFSAFLYAVAITFRGELTVEQVGELKLDGEATHLAWLGHQLLVATKQELQLWASDTGLPNKPIWIKPLTQPVDNCTARRGPYCQFLVASAHTRTPCLWHSTSTGSVPAYSCQLLLHPSPLCWAAWRNSKSDCEIDDPVLLTLAEDGVLRFWGPSPAGNSVYGLCWATLVANDHFCTITPFDNMLLIVSQEPSVKVLQVHAAGPELASEVKLEPLSVSSEETLQHLRLATSTWSNENYVYGLTPSGLVALELERSTRRLNFCAMLTGHTTSIRRLDRNTEGTYLLSQSWHSEGVLWRTRYIDGVFTIARYCTLPITTVGQNTMVAMHGNLVFALSNARLYTVRISQSRGTAEIVAETSLEGNHECAQRPLALLVFPSSPGHFVSLIHPECILTWYYSTTECTYGNFQVFKIDESETVTMVSQSDPVGSFVTVESVMSTQHFATLSSEGKISIWKGACEGVDGKILRWKRDSAFSACDLIENTDRIERIQLTSTGHLAVASSNQLIIANTHTGVTEQAEELKNGPVIDLDWCIIPGGGTLLAVGFEKKVVVYCQQRYDYSKTLDAWAKIRELDVSTYTPHPIADSLWLRDCSLVTGCGNQIFLQSAKLSPSEGSANQLLRQQGIASAVAGAETIVDISAVLNGPAPLYHPQLLIQLIYFDRIHVVARILTQLRQQLRFNLVSDLTGSYEIESMLDLDLYSLFDPVADNQNEVNQIFSQGAEELCTMLAKAQVPYITQHSQMTLVAVIQSLKTLHCELGSVDSAGDKFLLGYHLFRLHFFTQPSMNMRDNVFALRSRSKGVLLDTVLKGQTGPLTWKVFSVHGLPFWLEYGSLCEQTEALARQTFASTRDPVRVSLMYLALKKKSVLLGLWRISTSHPEQTKVFKMLSHDFSEPRWKEAALKNAYALMGRHRYEYAASWFVLAGCATDACSLIITKLNDLPLAVLVARVHDGDTGPAMRYIYQNYLQIPPTGAKSAFDRWSAVWGAMILQDLAAARDAAAAAFDGAVGFAANKRWMEDPVLAAVLRRLPDKYRLSPAQEAPVILRASDILSRMGCICVAADILATWQFSRAAENSTGPVFARPPNISAKEAASEDQAPTHASSNKEQGTAKGMNAESQPMSSIFGAQKPPPEMSLEPDMSAFGF